MSHPRHCQAETYVKVIQKGIKTLLMSNTSNVKINCKLMKYLFDYRNSIHSTTGTSPAQLVFGKQLRSRLDLLTETNSPPPSLTDGGSLVKDKQSLQVSYHGGSARTDFKISDRVLYKKYINKNKFHCLRGKIIQTLGKRLYLIEDELTGSFIRKHINQIIADRGQETLTSSPLGPVMTSTKTASVTPTATVFLPAPTPGPVQSTSVGESTFRPALQTLPEEPEDLQAFHPAEGEEGGSTSPDRQCPQQDTHSDGISMEGQCNLQTGNSGPQDTRDPRPPRQARLNLDFKKYF